MLQRCRNSIGRSIDPPISEDSNRGEEKCCFAAVGKVYGKVRARIVQERCQFEYVVRIRQVFLLPCQDAIGYRGCSDLVLRKLKTLNAQIMPRCGAMRMLAGCA